MKTWKRIVSFVIVFAMFVSGIQITAGTAKASEATEVTITGVGALTRHDATQVRFTLVTTGDFTATGEIQGFDELVTLSGMGDAFDPTGHYGYANGQAGRLWILYNGVSFTDVSSFPEGAKLTISAGTFQVGNTTYEIKSDLSMTYKNGAWVESVDATEVSITGIGALTRHSNTQVRFTVVTTGDFKAAGEIEGLDELVTLSGMGDAFSPTREYGYANDQTGRFWMMYDGVSFDNVSAFPEGAKLTIAAGTFQVGNTTYEIKTPFTKTYKNGEWVETVDATEVSITGIGALTSHNSSTVRFTIVTSGDFTTSGTIIGFGDLVTLSGMGDAFNPTDRYGFANGQAGRLWMMYDGVSFDGVSAFPEGAKLTIAAGTFQVGNTTYEIKTPFTKTYKNGEWVETVDATEVAITGIGGLSKHSNTQVRFTLVTTGDFISQGRIEGLDELVTLSGMGANFNPTEQYGYSFDQVGKIWMMYEGVFFDDVSAFPEGAKLTIAAGTFQVGNTTYEIKSEISKIYKNGEWKKPGPADLPCTTVTVDSDTRNSSGTDKGIYFTVSPADSLAYEDSWRVRYTGSCIYVDNNLKENVQLIKLTPNLYYADLPPAGVTPVAGMKVRIEGRIDDGTNAVEFLTNTFMYHNGKWVLASTVQDESQYKRATVKVYDLFELESLSSITIPEMKSVFNLTNLKQTSNVGLRMQIDDLSGEVAFGLSKTIANNMGALSGYDIIVGAKGNYARIRTMEKDGSNPKQAEATGLGKKDSFVLEFGVADLYPAAGGTEVVARRVYMKIDDAEVLSWIDTDMTRDMGSYVPAWAQYDTVVKSVDYVGYELHDAAVNVQDISEINNGLATFTSVPTREKLIGQAKKATNNALRMKVKWQKPVEGETDELLLNFSNNSQAGVWDGEAGGYLLLFTPNVITVRHVADASTKTQVRYEYPKDEFLLEVGTYDQDVYKDGKRVRGYSRNVYVKIDGEVVLTMVDKNLKRNLGKNVWVYSSENVVADLVSLTSDRYLIKKTPVVHDLFDISRLSKVELNPAREQGLGEMSASTNVAVRTKVTASSDCEELLFAFSKTTKDQFWDADSSGWEFWLRPKSKTIFINAGGSKAMCGIELPKEFVLEIGVRDVKYNNGEWFGRELYVAIDGVEVLCHVDKNTSRKLGNYVCTYVTPKDCEVTLESLTTKGYVPVEKNIKATDFYDVSGYASKKMNEGINYLGELSSKKNSAIKMRVNVNKDAEEFGISLGKAVKDKVDEDTVDANVSGWNLWFMPTYNTIKIQYGYYKTGARLSYEFPESFELEVGSRDVYYENGKYYGYEVYVKMDGVTIGSWIDDNIANRKLGMYVLSYINSNANANATFSTLYPTTTLPMEYIVNGEKVDGVDAITTETKVVVNKPSKITITTNKVENYIVNGEGVFLNETPLTPMEVENSAKGAETFEVKAKKGDKIVMKLERRELTVDESVKILDLYDVGGMKEFTVQGLSNASLGNMIADGNRQRTNSAFRFKITMPEGGTIRWGMYSDNPTSWGYNGFIARVSVGRVGLYNMSYSALNVVQNKTIEAGKTYYIETGMVKCYEDGNYKYNRWYIKLGESLDTLEQVCWYDSRERAAYGTTISFIGMDVDKPYTVETTYNLKTLTDVSTQENKDKVATYTVYRKERPRLHYPEFVIAYKDAKNTESPAAIKLHTKEGMKLTSLKVNGVNVINHVQVTEEGAYIYELPSVTQNINFSYTIDAVQ